MAYMPRKPMMVRCPSDLALEEYLLDRKSAPRALHIEACAVCHDRIALMEEDRRHFLEQVYPSTVRRIEDTARTCRRTALPTRRAAGIGHPPGHRSIR